MALGPRWAADQASGEVALLATRGLDALDGYFGRYLPQLALAAIVPFAVVVCLLAVDVVAALTVAVTVPLIPVFMVLIGKMSETHRARRWAALGRLAHRFTDVVAGLPTLRAYGRAEAQVAILRGITDAYRATTMATLRVAFLSALALELLATISVALVAVGVGLRLAVGRADARGRAVRARSWRPRRTCRCAAWAPSSTPARRASRRRPGVRDHRRAGAGCRRWRGVRPPADRGRGGRRGVRGPAGPGPRRARRCLAGAAAGRDRGGHRAHRAPGRARCWRWSWGCWSRRRGGWSCGPPTGPRPTCADLDADAWRARVAWVPQVPYLFAGLRGRERAAGDALRVRRGGPGGARERGAGRPAAGPGPRRAGTRAVQRPAPAGRPRPGARPPCARPAPRRADRGPGRGRRGGRAGRGARCGARRCRGPRRPPAGRVAGRTGRSRRWAAATTAAGRPGPGRRRRRRRAEAVA